jgi:hypothetical protein
MIFRLFLVPFLIVAVLVGLYLLGQAFYGKRGRTRSAEQYLRNLDSANPDIRWRAAADLSQELPRSAELAANAGFALELAERLHLALQESGGPEKDFAARHEGLKPGEKERLLAKELLPRRHLIVYLGACLGNFYVPVGVPLLNQLATQSGGLEADALSERRGRALFALAALGENLKRYDGLSDAEKVRIDDELTAASSKELQRRWAKPTLDYLRQRRQGKADSFGVAEVLRECSEDEDPYLRELTALASNFWFGTAKEDAVIEGLLVRLSRDAGQGEEKLEERQARNPDNRRSRALTRRKGFQVQANANLALARRGSPRVRLDLLEEMLDPDALREVFVIRQRQAGRGESPRDEPDEALVAVTVSGSLKAVAELHRHRPEMKLGGVREKVEALTKSRNPALRTEAEETLKELEGK